MQGSKSYAPRYTQFPWVHPNIENWVFLGVWMHQQLGEVSLFKECLEFVSWLLNFCRGIFWRSHMNSADFASNRGEGDWSEEVDISTLLVYLLWCDTCADWLRNSNVCIRNGCRIFWIIPCWCASLFQSTNALWPAFLAKIWQTMGTSTKCGSLAQPPDARAASKNNWRVLARGERLCVNSQRFFYQFIPSKNEVFEGHMFDLCVIIVATWWEIGWPQKFPK